MTAPLLRVQVFCAQANGWAHAASQRKVAVFPAILQIDKNHIFRKQDPIIVGCQAGPTMASKNTWHWFRWGLFHLLGLSIFPKGHLWLCFGQVLAGQLRAGTPLCVPDKDNLIIGHVAGIEINKKAVPKARRGDTVCVKIEQTTAQNHIMHLGDGVFFFCLSGVFCFVFVLVKERVTPVSSLKEHHRVGQKQNNKTINQ